MTASTVGHVYCVDRSTGAILWRFSTGEPVYSAPVVVGHDVYVITVDNSLFRISGKTGDEEWMTRNVSKFVAASSDKLYCMSATGRLVALDQTTGARVATLAASVPAIQINNQLTDRIFIGTRSGFIQCLHETANEWPLLHIDAAELAAAEAAAAEQPAGTPADAEPAASEPQPESTNPFGTPAGEPAPVDDPFDPGANPFDLPAETPRGQQRRSVRGPFLTL